MSVSGNQSNESSGMRDRAQDMAGRVVDKVQETASRIAGTGQSGGAAGGGTSGGQGTPVMEQAAEQVTSRMDMGKEYVVEAVTGVAQALRQTGQHLRDEGAQPTLAQYADRGAEQIETLGGYLRKRDTNQIMTDIEGFARRQPMVFAGSAFALGMLAVRFFRTESPATRQTPISGAATSYGASSYGAASPTPSPSMGRSTSTTTPGAATPMPRTSPETGQTTPNRPSPTTSPSSPVGGRSGTGSSIGTPGTPTTPGTGSGTSGTQPTRTPQAPPPVSDTPADARTTTRLPNRSAQSEGASPTSERPGAGY